MRPRFIEPKAEPKGGVVAETTQETVAPVVALTMDQLKELIAAASQGNQGGMTADALAQAMKKVQRPENLHAPMVSAFNPRGETEHPRPAFVAAKVTQNGVALDRDTLTWEEIEAINALRPGDYRVTKSNGQRIPFTVKFVRGFDEVTVERVEFHFPCRDEHREDHRPLFEYCLEVLEQAGAADEVARLRGLKAELDQARRVA